MSFGHKYARRFAGIDDHLEPSRHDPMIHERVGMGDTPTTAGTMPGMLQRFGINATQAALAVPTMLQTSGMSSPSAAGTKIVVKGVQAALNEIAAGAGVKERLIIDGVLGTKTGEHLRYQVGPDVMQRTWGLIYSVLRGKIEARQFTWPPVTSPSTQVNIVGAGGQTVSIMTKDNLLIAGGGVLLAALLFGGKKKGRR